MAGGSQVKNGLSVKSRRKNVKMKKKSARASPAGETSQRHRRDHAYFIGNHCGRVAGTLTCRGEVAPATLVRAGGPFLRVRPAVIPGGQCAAR